MVACQILDGPDRTILAGDELWAAVVVGQGEIDHFLPLFGDAHAAEDAIIALCPETFDDTIPTGGHIVQFSSQPVGYLLCYINIKASYIPIFGEVVEGGIPTRSSKGNGCGVLFLSLSNERWHDKQEK
ncbi:hypothetical protein SDC9_74251 [bioreactor metagenome]|uniref:Uncharacterized protein n=1 Tax=bioreactor metagenome TaxID=1076179 RepID=A0A644YIB8_9ZZZZ